MAVWREARGLVRDVYQLTNIGGFARDFGLRDQLRRSAVSIMSCVAEGFERGGDRDFRRFLRMAKGSAGEVRSLLYVAGDVGYLDAARRDRLNDSVAGISRQLGGMIKYLSGEYPSRRNDGHRRNERPSAGAETDDAPPIAMPKRSTEDRYLREEDSDLRSWILDFRSLILDS
jgi:four helix bundle protein